MPPGSARGIAQRNARGAGRKAEAPSNCYRMKWCYVHRGSDKMIRPKKTACEECNVDVEAMRRDAKAAGWGDGWKKNARGKWVQK